MVRQARRSAIQVVVVVQSGLFCCDRGEAYRVARVDEALNIDGDRLLFTRTIGHGADTIVVIA